MDDVHPLLRDGRHLVRRGSELRISQVRKIGAQSLSRPLLLQVVDVLLDPLVAHLGAPLEDMRAPVTDGVEELVDARLVLGVCLRKGRIALRFRGCTLGLFRKTVVDLDVLGRCLRTVDVPGIRESVAGHCFEHPLLIGSRVLWFEQMRLLDLELPRGLVEVGVGSASDGCGGGGTGFECCRGSVWDHRVRHWSVGLRGFGDGREVIVGDQVACFLEGRDEASISDKLTSFLEAGVELVTSGICVIAVV